MRILSTTFLITCLALSAFAQKAKRTSANNYLSYGELDNAKEAIDAACNHDDTKGEAKTWLFKGKIYHAIYETKEDKYKKLSENALGEAYAAYKKAAELDIKGEFKDDLSRYMDVAGKQFVNVGIEAYNKKRYDIGLSAFESTVEITAMPFAKRTDSLAIFYAGVCADQLGETEKADKFYRQAIAIGFEKERSYVNLARLLLKADRTDDALALIQEGKKAVPGSSTLITDEVNVYLKRNEHAKATGALDEAIKLDPKNNSLYFALGFTNDRLAAMEIDKPTPDKAAYDGFIKKAEENYTKAIELKADHFDALYNLGALFFNKAVKMTDAANKIDDMKKFEAAKKEADVVFDAALPHLEKAYAMNPNDNGVLVSLKQLYYRKMVEDESYKKKYDEVMSRMK